MLTSQSGTSNTVITSVMKMNDLDKQFINLKYEENIMDQGLMRIVNGMINSPNIKYNPILIERLIKIIDIKTSEDLKIKA